METKSEADEQLLGKDMDMSTSVPDLREPQERGVDVTQNRLRCIAAEEYKEEDLKDHVHNCQISEPDVDRTDHKTAIAGGVSKILNTICSNKICNQV